MLSIIVAIDDKKGIGKSTNAANKGMLWHISEDFKRFKSLTMGHPIIMGRKTHEMIGRVLPNRTNIIITRDQQAFLACHPELDSGSQMQNIKIVNSLEDAITVANEISKNNRTIEQSNNEEIFIIGGGQIFKEALEKGIADKLYLTLVKGDYDADIFFPEYEKQFPKVTFQETKTEGEYTYTFMNREK